MTDIGVIIFAVILILSLIILKSTKDIVAPPMIMLGISFIYFLDIFFSDYQFNVYVIYVLILLIILSSLIPYSSIRKKTKFFPLKNSYILPKTSFSVFWILTIPAVLAQIYMIQMFGGIIDFSIAAKHGTKNFAGLGILKSLITTYYPISLVYYAYLINGKTTFFSKVLYVVHFSIFVTLAILSLSRGTLLVQILLMVLIWHYSKKRFSTFSMVSFGFILLTTASLYGVVRETFTFDQDNFDFGLESREEKFKSVWMIVGLFPLDVMLSAPVIDKQFGMTYITMFTNFVPRSIWPSKPDAGGVVFTRDYTGDMYGGFSHFTTGMFPEAMINFGLGFGVLFGVLQLLLILHLLSRFHIKKYLVKDTINPEKDLIVLLIYLNLLWSGANLLTSEFTNIIVFTIIKVFSIITVYYVIRLSRRIKINSR
jgi:oligosaccharide repeat unit polymerase